MDCPICEKHRKKTNIVFENDNWVISYGPIASQVLGYFYIEPKRHVEDWAQFTDVELTELGPLIKKVELAIKEVLPVDRLYTVTISEAVRHLHVHLIPRIDDSEVKGVPLIEQATQQNAKEIQIDEEQFNEVIDQLRIHLSAYI